MVRLRVTSCGNTEEKVSSPMDNDSFMMNALLTPQNLNRSELKFHDTVQINLTFFYLV